MADVWRPPRWSSPATLAVAAVGLAVSVYLTVEHFTASTTLACPETGAVNCQRVTTSAQSVVLGIPVAVLGVVFFTAALLAGLPVAWSSPATAVRRGRLALAAVGAVSVLYLVWVELFVVDAVCLWCTVVHLAALGLFGIVVLATAAGEP